MIASIASIWNYTEPLDKRVDSVSYLRKMVAFCCKTKRLRNEQTGRRRSGELGAEDPGGDWPGNGTGRDVSSPGGGSYRCSLESSMEMIIPVLLLLTSYSFSWVSPRRDRDGRDSRARSVF